SKSGPARHGGRERGYFLARAEPQVRPGVPGLSSFRLGRDRIRPVAAAPVRAADRRTASTADPACPRVARHPAAVPTGALGLEVARVGRCPRAVPAGGRGLEVARVGWGPRAVPAGALGLEVARVGRCPRAVPTGGRGPEARTVGHWALADRVRPPVWALAAPMAAPPEAARGEMAVEARPEAPPRRRAVSAVLRAARPAVTDVRRRQPPTFSLAPVPRRECGPQT